VFAAVYVAYTEKLHEAASKENYKRYVLLFMGLVMQQSVHVDSLL
jgi:hypothetical protein